MVARTAQGDVYAWGWNRHGQVGNGSTGGSVKSPVKVLSGVSDVGAGHYSSFAVKNDGTVWAWGRNDTGQLGDGSTTNRRSPVQVQGLDGATIVQVSGGRNHTIALADDGTVYAWGNNAYGQLGDGTTLSRLEAEVVPGLADVVDLFAGRDHCLAVTGAGTVWSWGRNRSGQLGNGKTANRTSPVRVKTMVNGVSVNLSTVVAVGAGADHSLALTSGGEVYAWGANTWGQLGDGTFSKRTRAVAISSLSDIVAVAGGRQSSIALASSGSVFTWGDNRLGQLGDGETGATGRTTPVRFPGCRTRPRSAWAWITGWSSSRPRRGYGVVASVAATTVRIAAAGALQLGIDAHLDHLHAAGARSSLERRHQLTGMLHR